MQYTQVTLRNRNCLWLSICLTKRLAFIELYNKEDTAPFSSLDDVRFEKTPKLARNF